MAAAIFLAALALLTGALPARAQTPAELSFVRSFIGNCLHFFPEIERVRQTATVLKWPEITNPDARGMLGPSNPGANWHGWMMKADGQAFLIGISEAVDEGRTVKSCTLAADRVELSSIYRNLEQLVSLKKQLDFNEDGQRNQLWVYARDADRFALMATDGSPMKMNALSLSITNALPRSR
jgi:hypothetical protein